MIQDPLRFQKLNELKLLFINTLEVQYPLSPKYYYPFNLIFNNSYQLGNTLSLSTRMMWNVYANLKTN